MALTMTHGQWLQDTELAMRPRSSALKAVDAALLQYQNAKSERNLWRVRNAFEDWKRLEGPGWQRSDRNRKQAMTRLDRELVQSGADARIYQITHMSMAELTALAHMARHRKKALESVFGGKQVTLKAVRLKEQIAVTGEKLKGTCRQAEGWIAAHRHPLQGSGERSGHSSGRPVSDMLKEKMIGMAESFFGVAGLDQLGALGGLILDILGKCAVSIPPVVGHIKDGYDLFTGWAKVGADLYAQHSISECSYAIDTGVPSNAFAGLKECLKEETRNEAVSAANATSSFALKTGLLFVDGGAISGPVVGAVSALADFAHILYLLGMEYRATKAINRSLNQGTLDVRLFKTYPLMGCYMLVSATLSDLIPVESFATPGWMDYIESTHKNVFSAIYGHAVELIDKSPWEIMGLPKRPAGTSCGLFAEAQRTFATAQPLAGLAELRALA